MSKVIFNNRAYDSIEEASRHLHVPPKDLEKKLAKDREAKRVYPELAYDHWGFSEEIEYSSDLGSTDDMVDYEMFLDGLQTRTLEDIAKEDLELLDAEELERAGELAICLEAIITKMEDTLDAMEEITSEEEKIEKTLLQFEHDVLSKAEFPEEEEKESAGTWIKHND